MVSTDLQESVVNHVHETSTKINNVSKLKHLSVNDHLKKKKKTCLNFTVSFVISLSLSGSIQSPSLHSELQLILPGRSTSTLCPAQTRAPPGSRGRPRRRALTGFSSRHLVLEDHAKQLSSQSVCQPRVLDDGHLEALAAEHGVVVGVNGSAHSLDDHQVGLSLPNHHRQHFVQTARQRIERVNIFATLSDNNAVYILIRFSSGF